MVAVTCIQVKISLNSGVLTCFYNQFTLANKQVRFSSCLRDELIERMRFSPVHPLYQKTSSISCYHT